MSRKEIVKVTDITEVATVRTDARPCMLLVERAFASSWDERVFASSWGTNGRSSLMVRLTFYHSSTESILFAAQQMAQQTSYRQTQEI